MREHLHAAAVARGRKGGSRRTPAQVAAVTKNLALARAIRLAKIHAAKKENHE